MIDKNKKYTTRLGYPVEVVATDLKQYATPILAIYTKPDGSRRDVRLYPDGRYWSSEVHDLDLIEVKEKRKLWVAIAISQHGSSMTRSGTSQAAAIQNLRAALGAPQPFACVEIEVEEGQGL